MNYPQTIDYLYSRLPMFSHIGLAAYKKDLANTLKICDYLDHPHRKFKSIHIAGTNGKGSVSHMLAAILQTAGYKTGLYTSPHLKDFRERIRVNGDMISEEFVIDFTERIKPLIETLEPSFFEITVGMAFEYFAQEKVDIAVIEVGLGGRLDSTNVITPELSVITNIGWDHMNILGDTLEKIAFEKAGIIKPGIPVVIGESLPEIRKVFERIAKEKNAPISFAGAKRRIAEWEWQKQYLKLEVETQHHTDHKRYQLDLPGIYQSKNLLTVLEACAVLHDSGRNIDDATVTGALRQVKKLTGLSGRWEIIHRQPQVVLDVAHNEDGIRQLVQQAELTDHNQLHIILGVVKDKPLDKVLQVLPKTAAYYFTQAHIPRALPAADLKQLASAFDLSGDIYPDVNAALEKILEKSNPKDLVIVCGSVFLVAEVQPVPAKIKA